MPCAVFGAAPHLMFHGTSAAPVETTIRPPPPAPVEASVFDRIGDLGEGGFAKVSKVRHRRTGEVFAFKEAFYPSPDEEEEAQVLRRAAGSSSPFVVHCHAVFLGQDGGLATVLEFMDAGSLFDVLVRSGEQGFPELVLAEVANRCLMGLARLHYRGIAHLDVKPGNFLANSRGEVKINDFNTSRIVLDLAKVPTNRGTAAYFSPERFMLKDLADARGAMAADVWGLGLTILDLFTGRSVIVPEVEKPKAKDWMHAIRDREPPSVPKDVEASAELRDFVAACLQKDPTRRATVPQLLKHPFVARRDVVESIYALRQLIVEHL